jgi:hypothetical protein
MQNLTNYIQGLKYIDIKLNHVERREGSGPVTARQPDHQGAKSSPRDGKHEVSIGKMDISTSPVDAVRGSLVFGVGQLQVMRTLPMII